MTLTGIVVMGKHTDMVTNGNLTLLSVIQVLTSYSLLTFQLVSHTKSACAVRFV